MKPTRNKYVKLHRLYCLYNEVQFRMLEVSCGVVRGENDIGKLSIYNKQLKRLNKLISLIGGS